MDAGANIPPLVRQLGGRNKPLVQIKAAKDLVSFCAADPRAPVYAVDAGAIPALVQLLGAASLAVQEHAARALGAVCKLSNGTAAAAAAVAPCVQLLHSRSAAVQAAAAGALWSMVCSRENQARAAAAGAIPLLVLLLGSTADGGEIPLRPLQALCSLCVHNLDTTAAAVAAGAIPPLVQLLGSALAEGGVRLWAVKVLVALCLDNQSAAADAVASSAIPPLAQLLASSIARETRLHVTKALSKLLSCSGEHHTGAVHALVQLVGCREEGVSPVAVKGLIEACSAREGYAAQALAAGAVPRLEQLLGSYSLGEGAGFTVVLYPEQLPGSSSPGEGAGSAAIPQVQHLLGRSSCGEGVRPAVQAVQELGHLITTHSKAFEALRAAIPHPEQLLGSHLGEFNAVKENIQLRLEQLLAGTSNILDTLAAGGVEQLVASQKEKVFSLAAAALLDLLRTRAGGARAASGSVPAMLPLTVEGAGGGGADAAATAGRSPALLPLLGSPGAAERGDVGAALLELHDHLKGTEDSDVGLGSVLDMVPLLGSAEEAGGESAGLYRSSSCCGSSTGSVGATGSNLSLVLQPGAWHEQTGGTGSVAAPGGPADQPTDPFTDQPTIQPTIQPTSQPAGQPADQLTGEPGTGQPTGQPTSQPTIQPTGQPTGAPACSAWCSAAAARTIPALVQLLGCGYEEVQCSAALTLMDVSSGAPGARAVVVVAGAVPALVQLLGAASEAVQGQAAAALVSLCNNADKQIGLEAAFGGAVPALAQLLGSGSPALQQQAVAGLVDMACSTKYLAVIIET